MSFADDIKSMLDGPFGVSCTAGATTANGILDEPTSVVAGDQVLMVDRVVHVLNSGDTLTVGGTAYTVREVQKADDGLEAQISLQKT